MSAFRSLKDCLKCQQVSSNLLRLFHLPTYQANPRSSWTIQTACAARSHSSFASKGFDCTMTRVTGILSHRPIASTLQPASGVQCNSHRQRTATNSSKQNAALHRLLARRFSPSISPRSMEVYTSQSIRPYSVAGISPRGIFGGEVIKTRRNTTTVITAAASSAAGVTEQQQATSDGVVTSSHAAANGAHGENGTPGSTAEIASSSVETGEKKTPTTGITFQDAIQCLQVSSNGSGRWQGKERS